MSEKSPRIGMIAGAAMALLLACPLYVQAQPPSTVHPSWDKINFRPATLTPKVSGLGFLPDGRLVVADWGGTKANIASLQKAGKVFILKGVLGDNPNVEVTTFAQGLADPMGLAIVDGKIFVSGHNSIYELPDANNDGKADDPRTVVTFPGDHARHEFLFGLNYKDGNFYVNPSSAQGAGQSSKGLRGTVQIVNAQTGAREILGMGLRESNGGGFGPEGEYFVPDVQGNWLPANKLVNVRKDRFYGFKHSPAESWDNMQESPAAVYIPQDEVACAPGNPLYVEKGLYAGQMLMGDVVIGGIRRIFLEKVKGEWQGALFHFAGGFEAGVGRLLFGPDDHLYVGQIGESGGWAWNSKYFGLQKIKYNGSPTFEMLAVRALPKAMEIEFTEPAGAAAASPSSYTVKSWYYQPTSAYGGPNVGTKSLPVKSATLSADKRKVVLELPDLDEKRVVNIKLPGDFKSEAGRTVWTKETWYTHNFAGPGTSVSAREVERQALSRGFRATLRNGSLSLLLPGPPTAGGQETYHLKVVDMRGAVVVERMALSGTESTVSVQGWPSGVYLLRAQSQSVILSRSVAIP